MSEPLTNVPFNELTMHHEQTEGTMSLHIKELVDKKINSLSLGSLPALQLGAKQVNDISSVKSTCIYNASYIITALKLIER